VSLCKHFRLALRNLSNCNFPIRILLLFYYFNFKYRSARNTAFVRTVLDTLRNLLRTAVKLKF